MRSDDGAESADFDAFYAAHLDPAARLAHLITGSAVEGLDVAHDAMEVVHRRWSELRQPEAFLHTAVTNLCRSRQRRWVRDRRRRAATPLRTPTGIPELDETWSGVCRLPARQRAVVALRFYEDMTIDQIAATLGVPVGTVKSTLHRALDTLRSELS